MNTVTRTHDEHTTHQFGPQARAYLTSAVHSQGEDLADMAARDAAWAAFGRDPDWRTLLADPQYRENVSAISDIILRPTAYSQI